MYFGPNTSTVSIVQKSLESKSATSSRVDRLDKLIDEAESGLAYMVIGMMLIVMVPAFAFLIWVIFIK